MKATWLQKLKFNISFFIWRVRFAIHMFMIIVDDNWSCSWHFAWITSKASIDDYVLGDSPAESVWNNIDAWDGD